MAVASLVVLFGLLQRLTRGGRPAPGPLAPAP